MSESVSVVAAFRLGGIVILVAAKTGGRRDRRANMDFLIWRRVHVMGPYLRLFYLAKTPARARK